VEKKKESTDENGEDNVSDMCTVVV